MNDQKLIDEKLIYDLEQLSKDIDVNETNIYRDILNLINVLKDDNRHLTEENNLLRNSDLGELVVSNQEMEDQLVRWTELIRKKSDRIKLLQTQIADLQKENESLKESIECGNEVCKECQSDKDNGVKWKLKRFTQKLKESFKDTEYRAKTERKTISVEELKAQMDWILHEVVINTINETLERFIGEETC